MAEEQKYLRYCLVVFEKFFTAGAAVVSTITSLRLYKER